MDEDETSTSGPLYRRGFAAKVLARVVMTPPRGRRRSRCYSKRASPLLLSADLGIGNVLPSRLLRTGSAFGSVEVVHAVRAVQAPMAIAPMTVPHWM